MSIGTANSVYFLCFSTPNVIRVILLGQFKICFLEVGGVGVLFKTEDFKLVTRSNSFKQKNITQIVSYTYSWVGAAML